jgi:hypothetical protein
MTRTTTPDRINEDGSRTITMKRACNGCGESIGDLDNRDVDKRGNLTDVRGECDNCRPIVELEAKGCRVWQLTPRSFSRVARDIDKLRPWVFAKGYWEYVNGELAVVGIRVGAGENRVVALYGDWLIRQPNGDFTIHKAPTEAAS